MGPGGWPSSRPPPGRRIPSGLPAVVSDQSLKSDTIHPNAAGYAQIAQAVEQLLRDAGALP